MNRGPGTDPADRLCWLAVFLEAQLPAALRVLALTALFTPGVTGCEQPDPGPSEPTPPPYVLPDGPAATLEELGQVTCSDPLSSEHPLPFTEVTASVGVEYTAQTPVIPKDGELFNSLDVELLGGMTVADMDGDGHLDLLFTDAAGPLRWFSGDGAFGFTPRDIQALGLPTEGFFIGSSAADIDGDTDLDLFLLAREDNVFLRNDGGTFTDVTSERGLGGHSRRSCTAAWVDFDHDGDLDVFVANHGAGNESHEIYPPDPDELLQQQADGSFVDRIEQAIPVEQDGYGFIGGWFDADGDGWHDLYVVNDLALDFAEGPSNIFVHNEGQPDGDSWDFRVAPEAGLQVPMLAMGLALGDMDGDSDIDVHVSNAGNTFLARNDGDLLFTDISAIVHELSFQDDGDLSWATEFFDHDNDGSLELFTTFGHMPTKEGGGPAGTTNALYQYDTLWSWLPGEQRYVDIAPEVGVDNPAHSRTSVHADIDRDGFPDLVVWALYTGPKVFRSSCNDNAWLRVHLDDGDSLNRHAIGARVEAWTPDGTIVRELYAGSTGTSSSGPPEIYLGLGSAETVGLVVRWPDGEITVNPEIPTRQGVVLRR